MEYVAAIAKQSLFHRATRKANMGKRTEVKRNQVAIVIVIVADE